MKKYKIVDVDYLQLLIEQGFAADKLCDSIQWSTTKSREALAAYTNAADKAEQMGMGDVWSAENYEFYADIPIKKLMIVDELYG
jgi:hypothetical protein